MNALKPTSTQQWSKWLDSCPVCRCPLAQCSLICFIAPVFSAPVSNGMVSSTMCTEEALQLTNSGLSWVTAMVGGKVYQFLRGYTLILLMICLILFFFISLFFLLTLMNPGMQAGYSMTLPDGTADCICS